MYAVIPIHIYSSALEVITRYGRVLGDNRFFLCVHIIGRMGDKPPNSLLEVLNLEVVIDSGSTTTKIVVIDEDNNILFQHYTLNYGNPLKQVHDGLLKFYQEAEQKNAKIRIVGSTSTGYGEDLIKQAFNLDFGIVETIAHLMGAKFIDPQVS